MWGGWRQRGGGQRGHQGGGGVQGGHGAGRGGRQAEWAGQGDAQLGVDPGLGVCHHDAPATQQGDTRNDTASLLVKIFIF